MERCTVPLLIERRPYCPGTQGYIVNRKCAQAILALNVKLRMPIDNLMGCALYRTKQFRLRTLPMVDGQSHVLYNPYFAGSTQSPDDPYVCDDEGVKVQLRGYGVR